jgi:transcriptional regulator with XRE-family HTH domain
MSTMVPMSRLPSFSTPSPLPKGESLGERLQRIRKEKGVTQVDLAKQAGTTQVVISSYECGRTHPNHEMLARIAQVLGVSTDYILGLVQTPSATRAAFKTENPSAGRFQRRLDKFLHLPRRDQDSVLKFIDTLASARSLHAAA